MNTIDQRGYEYVKLVLWFVCLTRKFPVKNIPFNLVDKLEYAIIVCAITIHNVYIHK